MKITLADYINFTKLEEPTDVEALASLLGKTINDINGLATDKVDSLTEELKTFFDIEQEFTPYFKHNGVWYGFIPNLDKISYGENKDLITYISNWDTMHRAMAVAYRPIEKNWLGKAKISNGKYDIEKYEGTSNADAFLDLDISFVLGMNVFFWNLTKELLNYIPNYLQSVGKEMEKEISSHPSGEAIKNSIHYLKETLRDTKL